MAKEPPKDNTVYHNVEYWDDRFQHEEQYEWLAAYSDVRALLTDVIKPDHKVLIVGCGNSRYDDSTLPSACSCCVFLLKKKDRKTTQKQDRIMACALCCAPLFYPSCTGDRLLQSVFSQHVLPQSCVLRAHKLGPYHNFPVPAFRLGPDMYADGYTRLTCVDYSAVVIDRMKQMHADLPEIRWEVSDVRELSNFKVRK